MAKVSIIVPAYNEAENLPVFYDRLKQVMQPTAMDWEWIVVDDHSADETFAVAEKIAQQDSRVQVIRFSRNHGSHTAIKCGLDYAAGDCAIVLAADLQDPPELIPELIAKWETGTQVVWAVRRRREGEKASTILFSRLYYWMMRNIVYIKNMPSRGADFFLIDRRVVDAFCQFKENSLSVIALITWMGFRQEQILYDKQARLHGSSGWNLQKKSKLVVDSIISFTYSPIRLMTYLGFAVGAIGFAYAGFIIVQVFIGDPIKGWSSLMVVFLVVSGLQMLMMGVLGTYLWRALDEARRRPKYFIEAATDVPKRKSLKEKGEYENSDDRSEDPVRIFEK